MHREVRRVRSNLALPISFIAGNVIIALIVSSVFYNLDNNAGSISARGVLIFYSVLLNGFMTGLEVNLALLNTRTLHMLV